MALGARKRTLIGLVKSKELCELQALLFQLLLPDLLFLSRRLHEAKQRMLSDTHGRLIML
jgi:hypothetical protein